MKPTSPSTPTVSLEDQIREAAYFQWLDRGCPVGEDLAHWFAAEQQLAGQSSATPTPHATTAPMPGSSPAWSETPLHLHAAARRDQRPDVLASGANQRSRARHATGKAPGGFRT
jgi:hypothetical protein